MCPGQRYPLRPCLCQREMPQGSVLGPLLFALFTNYLKPGNPLCTIHQFADDQTLTCPIIPASLAEHELNRVTSWCADNEIEINLRKTKELIIKKSSVSVEHVKIGKIFN